MAHIIKQHLGTSALTSGAANDNLKSRTVIVADDDLLKEKSHAHRLAMFYLMMGDPRLDIPTNTNHIICDHLLSNGHIIWPNGDKYHYHDEAIEDAFKHDLTFRTLKNFLDTAKSEGPKQETNCRSLEWHRLLDLAIRIEFPKIAARLAQKR